MKSAIKIASLAGLALLVLLPLNSSADLGTKRASPHRRKAGESFPPLPLPATPLRRTEKKRPPTPPVLIGRISYGVPRELEVEGERHTFFDWKSDPACLRSLLLRARKRLDLEYTDAEVRLKNLTGDPDQIPILYITGHIGFEFTDEELDKLRDHLRAGGFLWSEACCGDPRFTESAAKMFAKLFPDRPLKRLAPDHPVFRCQGRIDKVAYREKGVPSEGAPVLYGIDLGCRTAIIHSPYDLGCGWEGHDHEGASALSIEDANALGVNMAAYCLAYHKLGKYLSVRKVYHEQKEEDSGAFVFGQVSISADSDPDPSGPIALLKELAAGTSGKVTFKRAVIDPASGDLLKTPFVYVTGHDDFVLSEEAVNNLRGFLKGGGFIFADACCGRAAFAAAFERELARIIPDAKLEVLPADHPLFSAHFKISGVSYSEAVQAAHPGLAQPYVKGLEIGGSVRVVLSPFGMGCSWQGVERPFAPALRPDSAVKLGVNILVYAMTH